jgi:uncharacterized protein
MAFSATQLGHGVGLRHPHYAQWLSGGVKADWLEATTENFMSPGGRPLAVLDAVRGEHPVALHGVSLSLGGSDPLSDELLGTIARLCERVDPAYVSDHLCWGTLNGRYAHDLLPLPFTEEALALVTARVKRVQDFLGRQILVENVSSYVQFQSSALSEWDFLAELAGRADCGILLDINNIYVSSVNHGFDPRAFLAAIPGERIGYLHLAGHSDHGAYLLDTHDAPVPDPVWALYEDAVRRFGAVSTLVEWDDKIPELPRLLEEAERTRAAEARALRQTAGVEVPA